MTPAYISIKTINFINMKELYAKIKVRREELGLTQRYIADLLELDPGSYSRIENGKVDITISRLEQISAILHISPTELLASNATNPNRILNNPKVTLQMDLEDAVKADVITLAFGNRILEIDNK